MNIGQSCGSLPATAAKSRLLSAVFLAATPAVACAPASQVFQVSHLHSLLLQARRTPCPAALACHAGRRCEALTPAALCALRQLDPASHDLHMRLLRFDDQLAELASRRGLLVRFVVQHSARSGVGARQVRLLPLQVHRRALRELARVLPCCRDHCRGRPSPCWHAPALLQPPESGAHAL